MNKRKIQQGVECKRVFIIPNSITVNRIELEALFRIMREQKNSGVDVYVIEDTDLTASLCQDLAIFDETVLSITLAPLGSHTSGIDVFWSKPGMKHPDVNHALDNFRYLVSISAPLEDYIRLKNLNFDQ
jgi:hypothetical protein